MDALHKSYFKKCIFVGLSKSQPWKEISLVNTKSSTEQSLVVKIAYSYDVYRMFL